jgi:hypothetical protein
MAPPTISRLLLVFANSTDILAAVTGSSEYIRTTWSTSKCFIPSGGDSSIAIRASLFLATRTFPLFSRILFLRADICATVIPEYFAATMIPEYINTSFNSLTTCSFLALSNYPTPMFVPLTNSAPEAKKGSLL